MIWSDIAVFASSVAAEMAVGEIAAWAGLVGAVAYGIAFLCFAIVVYRVYLR